MSSHVGLFLVVCHVGHLEVPPVPPVPPFPRHLACRRPHATRPFAPLCGVLDMGLGAHANANADTTLAGDAARSQQTRRGCSACDPTSLGGRAYRVRADAAARMDGRTSSAWRLSPSKRTEAAGGGAPFGASVHGTVSAPCGRGNQCGSNELSCWALRGSSGIWSRPGPPLLCILEFLA